MQTINLIPSTRRSATRRRGLVRAWVTAGIAYVIVAAGAAGIWRASCDQPDAGLDERIAAVATRIDQTSTAIATTNAELVEARSRIAAIRYILSQPDWSLLLAVLGKETGDQVFLRGCSLKREEPAPVPGAPRTPARIVLHLIGTAKTSAAVSQFSLRLEETHLFAKVALVNSSKESFQGSDAYGFQLDCSLDERK